MKLGNEEHATDTTETEDTLNNHPLKTPATKNYRMI